MCKKGVLLNLFGKLFIVLAKTFMSWFIFPEDPAWARSQGQGASHKANLCGKWQFGSNTSLGISLFRREVSPFVGGGKGIRGSLAPGKKAKRTKLQFVPFSRKPTTGRMTRGSTNIPKAKVLVVPTPQKIFLIVHKVMGMWKLSS